MHQQLALRPLRSMALVTQLDLELSKLTSALSVRLICAAMPRHGCWQHGGYWQHGPGILEARRPASGTELSNAAGGQAVKGLLHQAAVLQTAHRILGPDPI